MHVIGNLFVTIGCSFESTLKEHVISKM